jgi:sigma-E factor negative regulatory protein RseA
MTDTLRQSLSALVDQEATEFEARKILDATKSRGDLKEYWAACQAVSSTLRGEAVLGTSILDRVNAELDGVTEANPIADGHGDEVVPHVTFLPTKDPLPNRFVALTGQLAVAASIAFAVVIGVKVVAPVETQPTVASSEPLEIIKFHMPVQKETVSVDGMTNAQEVIKRRPVARILTEQDMKQLVSNRLSSYLVRHAENTAVIGGTSVLPLARIMGRDEPIE